MRFISTRTHSMLDLVVALLLILAPNLFGFSDNGGAAATIPRVLGIGLLLAELITDNGLSLARIIPMKLHLTMDYLAGLFLAVSPWLFGFQDQGTNAWLPHLVVGILILGNALMTKTAPDHRTTSRAAA